MSISMGSDTGGEYDVYWFSYNEEGLRVRKSVNGYADITYILNGSQIIGEKINNDILLLYIYDEAGSVIGLKYREAIYSGDLYDCYYFEKNLQGDIVAIYNEAGTKIGGYKYDAWGKVTAYTATGVTSIEQQVVQNYNPFRYRGYYYDIETGLYYLQSRYYNPEWGRFLNADGYVSTGTGLLGCNMFAYCNNSPITLKDTTGTIPILAVACPIVGVGALLVGAAWLAFTPEGQEAWNGFAQNASQAVADIRANFNSDNIVIPRSLMYATELSLPLEEKIAKEKDAVIPNNKKPAIFSYNPYDFQPQGLIMREYRGTGNGRIIKWHDANNMPIFEWDEDLKNGSHYHILVSGAHVGDHILPGAVVPEPWQTKYFGGLQ